MLPPYHHSPGELLAASSYALSCLQNVDCSLVVAAEGPRMLHAHHRYAGTCQPNVSGAGPEVPSLTIILTCPVSRGGHGGLGYIAGLRLALCEGPRWQVSQWHLHGIISGRLGSAHCAPRQQNPHIMIR